MKPFHFGSRRIGTGFPCFIIAEAGVNHDGDLEAARRLVRLAREVGADAVKFQTFQTHRLVARGTAMAEYQKQNLAIDADQAAMLKALELGASEFRELFALGREIGIPVFSTPDEEFSARLLAELDPPAFKIGSGEVTNLPFLRLIGGLGKPVILSTGMSTLAETANAVEALEAGGATEIAILHCVSSYPAPVESLNLRVLQTLAQAFPYPIGFSDHSLGFEASLGAVALGATLLEKHFTLDRSLPGPDHSSSLDPQQFSQYVRQIRNLEAALGNGVKQPAAIELATRAVVRKVLVATRDLKSGTTLAEPDLLAKRSDNQAGVQPADLEKVVGMALARDLSEDEALTWDHLRPQR
ncbi:MAG TPA: N-acetylneuraminate synthase family protein [Candidatus Ozemobacteraceae bacterium]|mgnify:CR=1 FL=1|nr:N-acetylneuraminate synthase family protein [Candidatus Ozemobacteraceae bacterium]